MVRAAAAEGLSVHPELTTCLKLGLRDTNESVIRATCESIGRLGLKGLKSELEKLTRPSSHVQFVGKPYARCDDSERPNRRVIIENHLQHGGMVELTLEAISASTRLVDLDLHQVTSELKITTYSRSRDPLGLQPRPGATRAILAANSIKDQCTAATTAARTIRETSPHEETG